MSTPDTTHALVRDFYGRVARTADPASCCAPSCCTPAAAATSAPDLARQLGYSDDDQTAVGEGANLGLGCGNPQAIAALRPGETVLDLGSGAGFDCFLAARQVGPTGRVVGVDMTPEMLARARSNATRLGLTQVEFREGTIERLPVEDGSVDVILSNCVINLSPDKPAVFREALRVLKPGGRLAIADVVAIAPLPDDFRDNAALVAGCIGGAASVDEVTTMLHAAGFVDVAVRVNPGSRELIATWAPGTGAEDLVASATLEARRAP